MVPKFGGVAGFILNIEQRLQPLRAQPFSLFAGFVGLVQPMRSNTRLSHKVHGFGTQLKFNIDARRPNQCGV